LSITSFVDGIINLR